MHLMNQTMILNKVDTTTMLIAIKITDATPNRKPPVSKECIS